MPNVKLNQKGCNIFNITEYNIPVYALFVNHKIRRMVAIYVYLCLNVKLFNILTDSDFEESVLCQFITLNITVVLLGCTCKSPNTAELNEKVLFSVFKLANKSMISSDRICIMGGFNYPSMKWNGVLGH